MLNGVWGLSLLVLQQSVCWESALVSHVTETRLAARTGWVNTWIASLFLITMASPFWSGSRLSESFPGRAVLLPACWKHMRRRAKPADLAKETELWSMPEVDQPMTRDIRHIFKWAVWSVMNEILLWSMTEPMFLWDHFKPQIKELKSNVFSLAVEHSPQNQIHSPKYETLSQDCKSILNCLITNI